MRSGILLGALLLITPLVSSAAGFADASLFLSKNPVTEGEQISIHAVVTNDSTTSFSGEVVFKDGETRLGSVSVQLPPGGAEATSISWQPAAGAHKITAELTGTDGTVAASESANFDVHEKEEVAATASSTVESSAKIKESIAKISPEVANASTPVFSTIDSARQKGVAALDAGKQWAESKKNGAAAENSGLVGTAFGLVTSLLLYIIAALKFLLSSAGIFYPVLAFAFFYLLWRLFKRMRRPSYE